MDADLEALKEFERFREPVECLLRPLLKYRAITAMPCKHGRTFQAAREARGAYYSQLGFDTPDDDGDREEMPEGYCDCGRFDRRNELWEIAEMCVKRSLTRKQMTEIAAIITIVTTDAFTYNHFHRAMLDHFAGEHKDFLKALRRQREKGVSFFDAMPGLVARWQWRMMPNV